MYWTRVLTTQNYDPRAEKSWPIGPDLSDEYDVLFQIDEDQLPELNLLFDHVEFSKTNQNPQLDAWRLPKERLEYLMNDVIKIRQQIDQKVE